MRLILIRHAESKHSYQGMIAGLAGCTGLTECGVAQTRKFASRLRDTSELGDCSVVLSSPVQRARQTAEGLASALPATSVEIDCDLCELHYGAADDLTWEAYRSTYGEFDLTAFPDRPFAPGGESWSDIARRVGATLDRLAGGRDDRTVEVALGANLTWPRALRRVRVWSKVPPPPEIQALLHSRGMERPFNLYLRV